jgi:hypothetical protein
MKQLYSKKEQLMIIDNYINYFNDFSETINRTISQRIQPLGIFLLGLAVTSIGATYYFIKYAVEITMLYSTDSVLPISLIFVSALLLITTLVLIFSGFKLISQLTSSIDHVHTMLDIKTVLYNAKNAILTEQITSKEFSKIMIAMEKEQKILSEKKIEK